MKTFIGTKMTEAKPMNRGEYNKYRGLEISENENSADEGCLPLECLIQRKMSCLRLIPGSNITYEDVIHNGKSNKPMGLIHYGRCKSFMY